MGWENHFPSKGPGVGGGGRGIQDVVATPGGLIGPSPCRGEGKTFTGREKKKGGNSGTPIVGALFDVQSKSRKEESVEKIRRRALGRGFSPFPRGSSFPKVDWKEFLGR